jgi:phage terminase large subunit
VTTLDTTHIIAWINRKFYPLWFDTHRFIVVKGGAGSGKSFDAHRRIVYRMITEPGHNYLVVRKIGRTLSLSCIPLIRKCIADWHMQPYFKENKSERKIVCTLTGNEIYFVGIDDPEKIKSVTFSQGILTDIVIEEATELSETEFNQLNLRLRGQSNVPLQLTLLFNPISSTHWIKRRFFDEEHLTVTTHESTYQDNRFLDAGYKKELNELQYSDPIYYEIYCLGQWGSIGNLVFRNIQYKSCPYTEEEFDAVLCGMDFGFNHYTAIEFIGLKDGNKYSYKELYVNRMTNDEIIAVNEDQEILSKEQVCIADSAEPKSIRDWQRAGYRVVGAKKGPDSVRQQINYLNRGTWFVDKKQCPGLTAELATYKWKEDKEGHVLDEPVSFHDDAIAACRYAVERQPQEGFYKQWAKKHSTAHPSKVKTVHELLTQLPKSID